MPSYERLVRSILGEQVYEALHKSIVKLGTQSVVDITELHDALKIAPKSVVAFLTKNLVNMKKDDAKELDLPWDSNSKMLINKMGDDVYKGHIVQEGKIVHEFDLCSIPQLAAHLLSFFELYDEVPSIQEDLNGELSDTTQHDIAQIKSQLQALESKINALIMLSATVPPAVVKKNQQDKKSKALKSLKRTELIKTGIARTMPKPSRPGVHSGSQKGITHGGKHGPKTPYSDFSVKDGQSQVSLDPNLKTGDKLSRQYGLPSQPKQPKQPKMSLTLKSDDISSTCLDCGEPDFVKGKFQKCACFKVMSTPDVKKSDRGVVTFFFKDDWDSDNQIALWHSLKKVRR